MPIIQTYKQNNIMWKERYSIYYLLSYLRTFSLGTHSKHKQNKLRVKVTIAHDVQQFIYKQLIKIEIHVPSIDKLCDRCNIGIYTCDIFVSHNHFYYNTNTFARAHARDYIFYILPLSHFFFLIIIILSVSITKSCDLNTSNIITSLARI